MKTRNPVDYPLHELLAGRWSPSGFADRSVPVEDLRSLFEAARWAPSAFNEQPWRYLVARKEEGPEYQRLLSCLVEANQAWARTAPVLAVTVARSTYTHNDRPNGSARHDIGLATACLTVEAAARGLYVHQMAGILLDRVSEEFAVPAGFEPVTGLAIGYLAPEEELAEEARKRHAAPRTRRPLVETVFAANWGHPAAWLAEGP